MIEPYSELPAMALAVIGFMVFMAVLAQAYTTYPGKILHSRTFPDASNLASKLERQFIDWNTTRYNRFRKT